MADVEVQPLGTEPAPADWLIPASLNPLLKCVFAHFDGTSASGAFVPELRVKSNVGAVVGRFRQPVTLQPGDEVDATWAPFLRTVSPSFLTDQLDVFGSVNGQVSGATPDLPWTLTSLPSPSMHIDAGDTTKVVYDASGLYSMTWGGTIALTAGPGQHINSWSFLSGTTFAQAIGESALTGGPATLTFGLVTPIIHVNAGGFTRMRAFAVTTGGTWFSNGVMSIQRWA